MPKPKKGARLGGSPAHQRLILRNLATSLFEHGRVTTTEAKARTLRPYAEKLITKAKKGDLHNRRLVLRELYTGVDQAKLAEGEFAVNQYAQHRLFTEIAPMFADRPGGYTRITKIGPRKGDNAPMAVIELVTEAYSPKAPAAKKVDEAAAVSTEQVEAPAEEAATEEAATEEVTEEVAAEEVATDEVAAEEVAADESAEPAGFAGFAGLSDVAEGDWAEPNEDGSAPEGFEIKGNKDSMKFHTPASQWYEQTVAEVWFKTEEAAEAAGFVKAG